MFLHSPQLEVRQKLFTVVEEVSSLEDSKPVLESTAKTLTSALNPAIRKPKALESERKPSELLA